MADEGERSEDAASVSRWARTLAVLLATATGGFGASQGVDLFHAKAWQEENLAKLMEAERTKDRLGECKAKVEAFEHQNQMLIDLVDRMQSGRRESRASHGDKPPTWDDIQPIQ